MATLPQRIGRWLRLIEAPPAEDASAVKKVSIHVEESGSSGTEIYSGYYTEEYLSKLRGTQAADLWDQMRRSDPKIKMVLSAVKNPILGAHWTVEPATQDEIGKKQAELVEQILFRDLHQSWTAQLKETLTFLDFGFSIFEVVHKVVQNHSKFGSYNSLAKIAWRSPRTIERWDLDPQTGAIKSVNQLVNGDLRRYVDIPGEFLLVFSNEKEGDNYEGVSALRPCYGPWIRKNTYLKLMAVGIEKFAVPTPYMEVPEGKEESNEFTRAQRMLENYTSHQKQYLLIPAGWKLDFASPSNFDASKVRDAIDKENNEMAQAFLENFLELGQSGSGSYALSNDLSDFFLLGIEHVAKQICETFNRVLIPDLIKLNFGPQENYPQLTVSGIKDKPGKEYAEILDLLVGAKIVNPDKDLEENTREKYGMPKAMDPAVPAVAPPATPAPTITPPTPQLSEKKVIHLAGERGTWSTAGDEKVCPICDPLDGKVTTREPPLHDNCRCTKDYDNVTAAEPKKLVEAGQLTVTAVLVSKKVAFTADEAKAKAAQLFAIAPGVAITENESHYRIQVADESVIEQGSLRDFEPMEGVTVYWGRGIQSIDVNSSQSQPQSQ